MSAPDKAVVKSFRLRSHVVKELESDAHRFRVSLNTVVSQILAQYAEQEPSERYMEMLKRFQR